MKIIISTNKAMDNVLKEHKFDPIKGIGHDTPLGLYAARSRGLPLPRREVTMAAWWGAPADTIPIDI